MKLFHPKKKKKEHCKREKREREKRREEKHSMKLEFLFHPLLPMPPLGPREFASIDLQSIRNGSTRTCSTMIDRLLTSFCHWKRSEHLQNHEQFMILNAPGVLSFDTERRGKKIWIGSFGETTHILISEIQRRSQLPFWIGPFIIQILIFHRKFRGPWFFRID